MGWSVFKLALSAGVIAFTSWLAGKKPALAGFVLALPISSLLALGFTQAQYQDSAKNMEFARSILVSVPLSLTFFLPFLIADRLKFPFWALYGAGLLLLFISYVVHRMLFRD